MTYAALLIFFALLFLGVPIYLTLGLSSAAMFAVDGQLLPYAQKLIDELNSVTLLAVPYFVIAATFMERGGVARALIDAADAWVGRFRGGLGLVSVVSCTIFAAMCGSSVATAIAMGTILVPAMLRGGYSQRFAAGVVGASGTLGILIPPSLAFVVYGVLADLSVPRLFLAGVVPGLLQASLIAAYVIWFSRRAGYATAQPAPADVVIRKTWVAIPALLIPVIVLGGLYGGFVTLTESAALSAVVAIFLSLFVYKGIRPREILSVMSHSVRNAAVIMIIIAVALGFGHWVTETGITSGAVQIVKDSGIEPWQFLLAMNGLLFVLGMFLEVYSVMLLIVPIVVPMLEPLGIDPIHFGVVMVINMELALLTPPVGLNLFVVANISKTPLADVIKGTTPLILLMIGLLMLITYVPAMSLWFPGLLMGQ
jgi:C4-dicarboxylate transporter DctM subunit